MKYTLISLSIFCILMSTSCHKKDMPSPEPCTNPPCDSTVVPKDTFMVWQIPMLPDFTYGFSMDPELHGDGLYFSNNLTGYGEPIHKVNKLTGESMWNTNDDCKYQGAVTNSFYLHDENIAFLQGYCLNFRNKSDGIIKGEINFSDFPNGACGPRLSGYGGWIFVVTNQYNEDKLTDKDNLVRINIETQRIDTLFSLPYLDGEDQSLEPPGVTVNSSGDTLLIFQSRYYKPSTSVRHLNLYCFNMTQKKLEWKKEDIEQTGIGAIYTPQILGDKVYYQGSNEVFMFDIATGNKIWSRRFLGESYYLTKHIIAENKIFMFNDGIGLRALNQSNGNTIWDKNDAEYDGSLAGGLCYHNGNIYFIGGDQGYAAIYGIHANNGSRFWQYRTPNYKKYSSSTFGYINMIADPETGYLYTGDGVFMMCLKPPK